MGLLVESIAIIAVIGIYAYMTARSGKRSLALAVLPLVIVPLFHLLSQPVSSLLAAVAQRDNIRAVIDVIGLALTCLLLGIFSGWFSSKRLRKGYLFICGGFSCILTCVFIHYLLGA